MSNVAEIIASEIAGRGPISFARFMELALYCPIYGYYEKQEDTIGRSGDYYTSVSVGGLFGELLAWQFAEWLAEPSAPTHPDGAANRMLPTPPGEGRQIVEAGAHDGRLAADILTWLRGRRPALFERLEYWIMEPSPDRRRTQQSTLRDFAGHVKWASDLEVLTRHPPTRINGVIFSNELLDSFPMHRIGWDARRRAWFEWGVAVRNGNFLWTRLEGGQSRDLGAALDRLSFPSELREALPDEFTFEICPSAERWWGRAAQALGRGKLLTFDYGLTAEELFNPHRKNGTLRAFSKHHSNPDVLALPGEQDLTAHVNFSTLKTAGAAAGLTTETFETQEQFLGTLAARILQSEEGFDDWTPAKTRQFQTLTHPEQLGRAFRVLVQARSRPPTAPNDVASS